MTVTPLDPESANGRRRVLAVDAVLAAVLLIATLFLTAAQQSSSRGTVALVLASCAVGSLALRRLRPDATVAVIGVCGAAVLGLYLAESDGAATDEYSGAAQGMLLATLAGLYAVSAYGRPRTALVTLGAALAGGLTFTVASIPAGEDRIRLIAMNVVVVGVLLTGVWSMGRVRRGRLREVRILAERNRALQAEKDVSEERAAAAERNRIAREMHDIVAHSLSAVIAQADGGRYAAVADPEAGRRALEVVAATSRDALTDMRGLLGVLRGDESDDGRAPLGVRDIPALVDAERVHRADVALTESADPGHLPPSLGLAVYRIVQEALTNGRVHGAPGNRTRVSVSGEGGLLTVTVEDTAPAGWASRTSPIPRGGRGILGMRERAAIHGGTLEARRTPDGFRVTAVIPIPEEHASRPESAAGVGEEGVGMEGVGEERIGVEDTVDGAGSSRAATRRPEGR
ncbi:sensor histidine kinase [Tomitella fengzijianii]|uniref:histidine kinase n=1 Tax=Tomitella fengzijianii TaxID=2597660 RepID=A0A516X5V0_9ACTN|nr:histidine kinase [Tomitella fengzijianii]QDQ98468.1 sensor histidine kinase [Tomitella fengzijianii]